MIYKCTYRIGLTDVRMSNNMTNKSILKVLENAGGMHSEEVGYGLNSIEKTGLSWVLLGWKVKVIKRPKYNTQISIHTWARDSNRVFTYRDYEIYDDNNNLLVIATSKWTLVDINKGKMAELTPEIINLYKREDKSVFEERNMPKLKEPASAISEISYPILRSDIDINNHVHNLYYLDFAYEALPEDAYRAEECDNIEIMYKKQIKLGDKIVCKYSKENNEHIISIKSEDESVLHAIVKLY